MKHVFIILAHKCPEQIYRLVNQLDEPGNYFVIHIDAKVEMLPFHKIMANKDNSVYFIEDRVNITWGSFSMIEASLLLLKYVKDNLPDTDRVTLLSGQDYPIKTNKFIKDFFAKNKDVIYLNFFRLPFDNWYGGGISRFPNFYRIDKHVKIYGGSQWWSLPFKIVSYILDFIENNSFFLQYFKTVTIPDESFFQTLLLNCDDAFISCNLQSKHLWYIKWAPPYAHPSILRTDDLPGLMDSDCLFARKFDFEIDKQILDSIDEHIKPLTKVGIGMGNQRMKKQAFLYLTHRDEPSVLESYEDFVKESSNSGDCHLLFHNRYFPSSKHLSRLKPFMFDDSILTSLSYQPISEQLIPGNNHFPVLAFYLKNSDYDYYWLIEDDVKFNGKWSDFFNSSLLKDVSSDFLTTNINKFTDQPYWYWWNSLKHPEIQLPNAEKIRSFNPIYRISNAALKYIDACLREGWSGHHEVLIPSLLLHNGYSVNDFSTNVPYGLMKHSIGFYEPASQDYAGGMGDGSMRYRPEIKPEEMTKMYLYHPVKNNRFSSRS
ncbi:beta-1,6-N-acetylglucosaminyltransferase [Pedobacter sp. HDW13]|uniref:beta-1,6-N-acetylglucosaminyltransferase n=1 Tax=unclassified Pedobacter TaxID=2628915 RepID=UPI000F591A6F|nr:MULTISPECIES: beta-1,6-N-acetylglucosaminyltransferase [unclassified Pedobacter]QIL38190.1 beta-1,6-N-acetylglucosaminyltransferase [Pedobacter sp. HDW13]RQO64407.1 hypothetical protein DBR40_25630 [Pedobacter sp. KBW01]